MDFEAMSQGKKLFLRVEVLNEDGKLATDEHNVTNGTWHKKILQFKFSTFTTTHRLDVSLLLLDWIILSLS